MNIRDEGNPTDRLIKLKQFLPYHQMRDEELLILKGSPGSPISSDKISNFSLCPPGLCYLIDQVGLYYRWFHVNSCCEKYEKMKMMLHNNIKTSCWID